MYSSAGEEHAPPPEIAVAEAELIPTSFEQSVVDELERIRSPRRSNWTQAVAILAVSLVLFMALGMGDHPFTFTLMLVAVLFVHELGHYLGMRVFGYQNVRMFFIPMFGAAVSGRKAHAKSYQEAIVTLLGPLPGLILSVPILAMAWLPGLERPQQQLIIQAGMLFALINAFNLLPVLPLDGGRLLNQLLFSRHPYVEVFFQLLAAGALVAYGAWRGAWLLLLLGVWLLITLRISLITSSIAKSLRRQLVDTESPVDAPIPFSSVRIVVQQLQSRMPDVKQAKAVAALTSRIWERIHVRPPGPLATVVFLAVYVLAAALTLPWMLMFMFRAN